jgi:hypothetical protein
LHELSGQPNETSIPGGPQVLLKMTETFFYVTTWSNNCVYGYLSDG